LICHGERKVCVDLAEPGERCEMPTDCITFICTASSTTSTTTKTCGQSPATPGQCFYASACNTFGSKPSDLLALALVLSGLWIIRLGGRR
jgi:hypothetical protein